MARPKRNELAAKDLHRHVQRLVKKRHINSSPMDVVRWAYAEMGVSVSDVTVAKMFDGTADPAACSIEALVAVAGFLGATPAELGTVAEERLNAIGKFYGPNGPGQQGIAGSGWITDAPERHLRAV